MSATALGNLPDAAGRQWQPGDVDIPTVNPLDSLQ